MISLDMITKEAAMLLEAQLKLDFTSKSEGIEKTQTHVDFICSNLELSQSLDDLSEKTLRPAINALLSRLVKGNARYSYDLSLPRPYENLECYKVRCNGINLRGLINRKFTTWDDDGNETLTNCIRLDILWST